MPLHLSTFGNISTWQDVNLKVHPFGTKGEMAEESNYFLQGQSGTMKVQTYLSALSLFSPLWILLSQK
jgi:hypothetical protein